MVLAEEAEEGEAHRIAPARSGALRSGTCNGRHLHVSSIKSAH